MTDFRRTHQLSKTDRDALISAKNILEALSQINHKMPISYARAFVEVALAPGKGPTDYGRTLDVVQPIMSRILLELSAKTRHRVEATELLEHIVSAESGRQKEFYLTTAGMTLMYELIRGVR